DQQVPFGWLIEQPAREMPQRRAESGIAARQEAEVSRHHGALVLEIAQAGHVHAMPCLAVEDEQPMAFTRNRHRMAERVGAIQLQLEDASVLTAKRSTAVKQQRSRDIAEGRLQVAEH